MKRTLVCSLAFALAVALTGTASAAIIGSATVVAPPFAGTEAGLAGFTAYKLSLASDGAPISALDVLINGALHQRWTKVTDEESGAVIVTPTPVGNATTLSADSRLNIPANGLIAAAGAEDNSGSGSPLADTATRDYGMGTFLSGAWGIPGPSQTNSLDFAYIVVPDGTAPSLQMRVEVASNDGTFSFDTADFFIPEPTSLSLAGLSLIGLVLRRRNG